MKRLGSRKAACLATALVLAAAAVLGTAKAAEPVRVVGRLPVDPDASGGGMVFWLKGRKAYQFKRLPGANIEILSYDLDTLQPTGLKSQRLPLYASSFGAVVDENTGRIFIPNGPGGSDSDACVQVGIRCMTSMSVVDGATLQLIDTLRMPAQGPSGPKPLAISFSPARGPGDRAKIHLLYHEAVQTDGLGTLVRTTYVTWLAQWDPYKVSDPLNGVQDWVTRLEPCTSARQEDFGSVAFSHNLFRSPDLNRSAVYVACYGSGVTATAVRLNLSAAGEPEGTPEALPGPSGVASMLVDPASERILMKSQKGGLGESWWVYDGQRSAYVGVIGISPTVNVNDTASGVDPTTGRLYAMAPPSRRSGFPDDSGGFLYADARRTPLPQAAKLPQFARQSKSPILVDPAADGRPTRIFVREGDPLRDAPPYYEVFEDKVPISTDANVDDYEGQTKDIPEVPGQTQVSFTGTARGYGLRAIFLGGLEAVPRDATATDLSGIVRTLAIGCADTDRELVLGLVGPGRLTDGDALGRGESFYIDGISKEDFAKPAGRCAKQPLEPQELLTRFDAAECVTPAPLHSREADPLLQGFSSEVGCATEVTGTAQAQSARIAGIGFAEAFSTMRVYRDPVRGLVSRTESYVRGLQLASNVRIDSVRSVAESWANGRKQPPNVTEFKNCDVNRTAGTCYQRFISGVDTPVYRCGTESSNPCTKEREVIDGINKALGVRGRVRLREPDTALRKGSPNGYLAAIQKPEHELFVDSVLLNDSFTALPGLEFIRYVDGSAGRGRQIVQFAGVESAASYSIEDLTRPDPGLDMSGSFGDPASFEDLVASDVPFGELPTGGFGMAPTLLKRFVQGVGKIVKGILLTLASPKEAGLMAAVWVLLVLPAYLSERRRLIDRLVSKRGGTLTP